MDTHLMNRENHVVVGSRASELALVQTNWVISQLKHKFPHVEFSIKKISTQGDKILDVALSKIGSKNLFTKELDRAIHDNEVDFVVHSLKDVPTTMPEGMVLGCICRRHSCHDAVVMSAKFHGHSLSTLPKNSTIGTSSVRRCASLKRAYPNLNFVSIRGNLNTRLAKLDGTHPNNSCKYDAIVLAEAGINRLGWDDRISQVLTQIPYAVSQGALACQCRENDEGILSILATIHNEVTCLQVVAERAFMNHLDGGCSTPIAVRTLPSIEELAEDSRRISHLELNGWVYDTDGSKELFSSLATNLPFTYANMRKRKFSTSDYYSTNSSSDSEQSSSFFNPGPEYRGSANLVQQILSEEEVFLANNQGSVIMGIKVRPICRIGLMRMARAKRLGSELADRLLSTGADEILAKVKAEAKINSYVMPEKKLQELCNTYSSTPST